MENVFLKFPFIIQLFLSLGGMRGGFMELLNIEEGVLNNLYKLDGMYSTPNNSG